MSTRFTNSIPIIADNPGVPRIRWALLLRRLLDYGLLLLVAFFMSFPFLWMILSTFQSPGAILSIPPKFVPDRLFTSDMFAAYVGLFEQHNFARYTLNSFVVSFLAALGQLFTCSLAGFAFARMKFKGGQILFALLLATSLIPSEVTIIPEYLLALKVFDPALEQIGLTWTNSFLPLVVPAFFVGTFGTFLLREFFSGIPQELDEAAVIDGASTFQIYLRIYLPLSVAPMITLYLWAFIGNWNALLRPLIYIKDANLRTLPIGLTTFQTQYGSQWEQLLAGSVVTILPLVILYIFMQRYIVEGISTTGLKG